MARSSSLLRRTALGLLGLALSVPCLADHEDGPTAKLSPEMTVRLILVDRLRSGASQKGDRVTLRVDEDVVDNQGNVLIRKGTPAYGSITGSRKNGMFGKRGTVDFAVEFTTAVDDQPVRLQAAHTRGGKSGAGGALATAALLSPVGLFFRGGNAVVEPGTMIIAQIGAPQMVRLPNRMPLTVSQTTVVTADGVVTQASASEGPAHNYASGSPHGTEAAAIIAGQPLANGATVIGSTGAGPVVVSRSAGLGMLVVGGAVVFGGNREQLPTLETLVLKNGDRVTGSIESMNNGFYTVVTKLGTLRIAKTEVKRIEEAGLVQKVPTLAPKRVATRSNRR